MTENDACEQATVKAKRISSVKFHQKFLSAKTEMNCSTKDIIVEVVGSTTKSRK